MSDLIRKLINYSLDCVKTIGRSDAFNNLKKDEILIIQKDEFSANEKDIVEIMTKYALNRSTMNLLKGKIFIQGEKINTPLIYCEIALIRENNKIKIEQISDYTINYSFISSLLKDENEIIENIVEQLNGIDEIEKVDLISILSGLIPSINEKMKIEKDKEAIILTKSPESTAGLINELRLISEAYNCKDL